MDTRPDPGSAAEAPDSGRVLVFTIAGRDLAVAIGAVIEIRAHRGATDLPLSLPGIEGVVPVRGRMVTLLDLRSRLGLPDRPPGMRQEVIVLQAKGDRVGLVVDSVKGVDSGPHSIRLLEIDALLEEPS